MTTTGPNTAGTGAEDTGVGTLTVSNPTRITAHDASYSDSVNGTGGSAITHYWKATNFGFALGSDQIIDGITVEVYRKCSNASAGTREAHDATVKLVIGGTISGSNLADTGTLWPTSAAYATYGGASSLWGLTPSYSDINGATFGVVVSATNISDSGKITVLASIDDIRITITSHTNGAAYGTSTSASSAGSTAPSTSTPSSTATGDHLIWGVLTGSAAGTVTPPSGFTAVPSGTGLSVSTGNGLLSIYTKTADGTEGASLTGSMSSATWICFAIRTTGTLVGIDTKATGTNGDSGLATATIPSISTNYINEIIYLFQCEAGALIGPYTAAGGTTEVIDANEATGNSTIEIAYATAATATSYGSWVVTGTNTNPFANWSRYFTLVLGQNLGVTGFIFPNRRQSVAVQRAAYW